MYTSCPGETLDFTAPQNCACFNVRRVARAITQFYDAEVRRHGLRPTQVPILSALEVREGWNSMAELSDWLGLERTTLVRNLRPLERDGLVRATGGGRGGHVELGITAKGRRALARVLPAWRSGAGQGRGDPLLPGALVGDPAGSRKGRRSIERGMK